jgi:hypothetical protein
MQPTAQAVGGEIENGQALKGRKKSYSTDSGGTIANLRITETPPSPTSRPNKPLLFRPKPERQRRRSGGTCCSFKFHVDNGCPMSRRFCETWEDRDLEHHRIPVPSGTFENSPALPAPGSLLGKKPYNGLHHG